MAQKVAIVGSGFLGMTIALRLASAGAKVTLFESSGQIGGLASTWKIGNIEWDKHYHVTLGSDSFTRGLIGELGLEDQFKWVGTRTGFYTGGKLYSMSDALEFLRFPPLGLIDKLRLGATIFYASKAKNWRKLEQIPVGKWLTRLSGRATFEKIWKPLLKAKLGDAYKVTSAAFIWATIQRMYAARRSGMKTEMFGYVRGGYASVLRKFSGLLVEKGVNIRLNSRIESIKGIEGGRCRVIEAVSEKAREAVGSSSMEARHTNYLTATSPAVSPVGMYQPNPGQGSNGHKTDSNSDIFDKVILTCPSDIAAGLLPQLSEKERNALEGIRYQGIVCASVLLKYPLSQFYVTNITDPTPFTGIIEMSALVDKRELGQNSLVYLPKYVASDDPIFEASDAEIEGHFLDALEAMYPHFHRKDVIAFKISRVRRVFPLPVLNYSETVPLPETSIKNVFVVNSTQIVNGTLNINETVQLGERFYKENFEKTDINLEI